eukprot:scaffold92088_cov31-Tisochrysis_lutea.AAC.1
MMGARSIQSLTIAESLQRPAALSSRHDLWLLVVVVYGDVLLRATAYSWSLPAVEAHNICATTNADARAGK